jgi:hypothetical protein
MIYIKVSTFHAGECVTFALKEVRRVEVGSGSKRVGPNPDYHLVYSPIYNNTRNQQDGGVIVVDIKYNPHRRNAAPPLLLVLLSSTRQTSSNAKADHPSA